MWLTGLVAPRHVGSSQTRARTRVPCIGRQILNHCATREAPKYILNQHSTPIRMVVTLWREKNKQTKKKTDTLKISENWELQAYLFLLCFTLLHFAGIAFFTNWRLMATLCWTNLSAPFFLIAFAYFMSRCHILVILAILQTFSLLLYLSWWSVIFDVTVRLTEDSGVG